MKIFQKIRKILQLLGICTYQNDKQKINIKTIGIMVSLLIECASGVIFFLYEAKTLFEYSQSAYLPFSVILVVCVLFEINRNVFPLITGFEAVINSRKCKTLCVKFFN